MNVADIERHVYGSNPVAWFEVHGRIEDKEVGSDPNAAPSANYLQRVVGEAIEWCLANRRPIRLILYKPRQQGCSTITIEVLYVLGRYVKMKILVIGGQASQTDNLWKILRYYGEKDQMDWGNTWECNAERGTCSNGTLWERETAGDKEAGRSGNFHAVIATEVARWPTDGAKNASDVLNSVLNCVGDGPGTCVIMESTAQGPKGEFPKTWSKAVTLDQMKKGEFGNSYIKIFAPWYKFPRCWTALEPGETAESLRAVIEKAGDEKAIRVWDDLKLSPEQIKWYHLVLEKPECGGDLERQRTAGGCCRHGSNPVEHQLDGQQAHICPVVSQGSLECPLLQYWPQSLLRRSIVGLQAKLRAEGRPTQPEIVNGDECRLVVELVGIVIEGQRSPPLAEHVSQPFGGSLISAQHGREQHPSRFFDVLDVQACQSWQRCPVQRTRVSILPRLVGPTIFPSCNESGENLVIDTIERRPQQHHLLVTVLDDPLLFDPEGPPVAELVHHQRRHLQQVFPDLDGRFAKLVAIEMLK